jgi:uncharacterized protein with PIN domain
MLGSSRSPYGIVCIRCSETLISPSCSEYITKNHIRHFCSCEACGAQFDTLQHVPTGVNRDSQNAPEEGV